MKSRMAVYLLIYITVSTQITSNLLAAEASKPRSRSEIEAVLAKAPKPPAAEKLRELNIILVAFKKDLPRAK